MIELKNIYKSYDGKVQVVQNLNLTIYDGEIVVLVGESGCGKTTTLQMINRLVEPSSGDVFINGENIKSIHKNELRRKIGYVIQDVGLFPHKTVEENISIVPKLCKKDKKYIQNRVVRMMELIGMPYGEYAGRYPSELSGGQKQRVGVARAMANDPELILMDEPFSALDPITREQLQDELLRVQDRLRKTIVFVTHDMDEAIKLGDKIAIMKNGEIAQFDTPEEILKNPADEYVAEFIGRSRLWKSPDMLKAEDVMADTTCTIEASRTALQAIELIKKHNCFALAVTERSTDGCFKFLGIVGLNRLLRLREDSVKVKEIMKTDVIKIRNNMPLPDVFALREKHGVLFSPVVDEEGHYLGMITNTSIINVLSAVIPGKEEY